jgi:pyruvate,water dikinase
MSPTYTLPFESISAHDLPHVGGKGANLGALTAAGVPVPPGFCVTTSAFDEFIGALPGLDREFDHLDALDGRDVHAARKAAERLRAVLGELPVPDRVAGDVITAWSSLGVEHALAVRSSATAEDLPGASFAGQQDTYLNIQGESSLLDAVRRCWVSLFTDRAVLYRAKNGFGHRGVRLAVVVQRLIDPDVSGILFTADPVSGRRDVVSIDAGFGLGEALVGGLINADLYKVRTDLGAIVHAEPGDKRIAIRSIAGGGTREEALSDDMRRARALDDAQVLALAELGRRVEKHYGGVPQDIEWCIQGGRIYVVQARPITHLYPLPEGRPRDAGSRVYVSFGHVQMMTDAMPRLAREVWASFVPVGKGGAPTVHDEPALSPVVTSAGGRLYLDVSGMLRVPSTRAVLLGVLGHIYADMAKGVAALSATPEFKRGEGDTGAVIGEFVSLVGPLVRRVPGAMLVADPDATRRAWERLLEEIPAQARARVEAVTPDERLRQTQRELGALFGAVRPSLKAIPAGILAHRALARLAQGAWADRVRGDIDTLLRGLPGNVTTEMDLRVGDLSDKVRPHPELAEVLRTKPWSEARALAPTLSGGRDFIAAMDDFLVRYGMRGAGEIDVSRPRWRDDPSLLVRVIVGGLSAGEVGAHRRRHAAQVVDGDAAAERIVAAAPRVLRPLVARLCRVVRTCLGLREHPKYGLVQILAMVRAEALAAGARLVERGQLASVEEVWHFGFDEIHEALARPERDLRDEARVRRELFARDAARKPPFVMSSEGEVPSLAVDRKDLPANALPGTAASAGVIEGVVRVVLDPSEDTLLHGEILVAPYTDPGWTPLFIHAAGVITEVGGLMTHGAVVAREYGIPAVVSVEKATERLRTGQRVRLDGTRGFVLPLDAA